MPNGSYYGHATCVQCGIEHDLDKYTVKDSAGFAILPPGFSRNTFICVDCQRGWLRPGELRKKIDHEIAIGSAEWENQKGTDDEKRAAYILSLIPAQVRNRAAQGKRHLVVYSARLEDFNTTNTGFYERLGRCRADNRDLVGISALIWGALYRIGGFTTTLEHWASSDWSDFGFNIIIAWK